MLSTTMQCKPNTPRKQARWAVMESMLLREENANEGVLVAPEATEAAATLIATAMAHQDIMAEEASSPDSPEMLKQ